MGLKYKKSEIRFKIMYACGSALKKLPLILSVAAR